jgi:transcriptional regulator with XRE-family HTH domain
MEKMMIDLFNWPLLVETAIQRRRDEKLTQKKHAALAGVSIPTMISFERAETTISIEKVLSILQVVGMVAKLRPPQNKLETFALEAQHRWLALTKGLEANSPARHTLGYVAYSFEVEGELKKMSLSAFDTELRVLSNPSRPHVWPPFWVPTRDAIKPYPIDDKMIECWLGNLPDRSELLRPIPADTDFWRVSKEGYAYLQRGYIEDSNPTVLTPGTIFDLCLPIKNVTEVVFYAYRFAQQMCVTPDHAFINLHIKYAGLHGRTLVSWSEPLRAFFDNKKSNHDIAETSIRFQADLGNEPMEESITQIVYDLLSDVYASFAFFEPQYEFVKNEVKKFLSHENTLFSPA